MHLGKGTGHGVFPDMQAGMLFGTGNNLLDGTWPDWPARVPQSPTRDRIDACVWGYSTCSYEDSISNTEVVECI